MKNNQEKNRYELEIEGFIVFADYRLEGKTLYINHVEAPQELRGKGAAGKLMQEIADYAREQNLKIVPICGYAANWLQRHA
jgi:hypothetical protein